MESVAVRSLVGQGSWRQSPVELGLVNIVKVALATVAVFLAAPTQ